MHQIWMCDEKFEIRISRSSIFFKTIVLLVYKYNLLQITNQHSIFSKWNEQDFEMISILNSQLSSIS